MRDYELVFIIHPDQGEETLSELVERVKNWITGSGGVITKEDVWGMRKLAYPIRKQKEGQYFLMQFQADPSFISELDRNMHLVEPIIRHLVTNL